VWQRKLVAQQQAASVADSNCHLSILIAALVLAIDRVPCCSARQWQSSVSAGDLTPWSKESRLLHKYLHGPLDSWSVHICKVATISPGIPIHVRQSSEAGQCVAATLGDTLVFPGVPLWPTDISCNGTTMSFAQWFCP